MTETASRVRPVRPSTDLPNRPTASLLGYVQTRMVRNEWGRDAMPGGPDALKWMHTWARAHMPERVGPYLSWLAWFAGWTDLPIVQHGIQADWPDVLIADVLHRKVSMQDAALAWSSQDTWDGYLTVRALAGPSAR